MTNRLTNSVKSLSAILLLYSGIASIYRFISNMLCGNPVSILCAHRIIDDSKTSGNLEQIYLKIGELKLSDFQRKLKLLKEKVRFISLNDYLEALDKGTRLPQNCLILTFDDGYEEHYSKVYPILKGLNIPAIFFIPTVYISSNECKWDDKIAIIISQSDVQEVVVDIPSVGKEALRIGSLDEKAVAVEYVRRSMKYLPEEKKDSFVRDLTRELGVSEGAWRKGNTPLMMSWEQAREIDANPLMAVEAHSCSHAVLSRLPDRRIREEVFEAKKTIEDNVGRSVNVFSYPFGKLGDFDERVKKIVKEAEYKAAFSYQIGRNGTRADRYALRRIPFTAEPYYVFKVRMMGIFDSVSRWKEGRITLRAHA